MTSFSMDEQSSILNSTPIAVNPKEPSLPPDTFHSPAPVSTSAVVSDNSEVVSSNEENNAEKNDSDSMIHSSKDHKDKDEHKEKIKADKKAAKKLMKELTICKIILEEMEVWWLLVSCYELNRLIENLFD